MAFQIHFTRTALAELEAALAWLRRRSPAAAERWFRRIEKDIATLESKPLRCPLAPEAEFYPGELRQLISAKRKNIYRILFEIREDTVYIVRIRLSAQDLLFPEDS